MNGPWTPHVRQLLPCFSHLTSPLSQGNISKRPFHLYRRAVLIFVFLCLLGFVVKELPWFTKPASTTSWVSAPNPRRRRSRNATGSWPWSITPTRTPVKGSGWVTDTRSRWNVSANFKHLTEGSFWKDRRHLPGLWHCVKARDRYGDVISSWLMRPINHISLCGPYPQITICLVGPKGIVHLKLKTHSLSTHHFAGWGGGGSAWVHKTRLEFRVNRHIFNVWKQQKKNMKCLHTAAVVSSKSQ